MPSSNEDISLLPNPIDSHELQPLQLAVLRNNRSRTPSTAPPKSAPPSPTKTGEGIRMRRWKTESSLPAQPMTCDAPMKPPRLPYSSASTIGSGPFCRICLSASEGQRRSDGEDLGRLITPCRCSGSLGHVHEACIDRWRRVSGRKLCEFCQFRFVSRLEWRSLREFQIRPLGRSICGICFWLLVCAALLGGTYLYFRFYMKNDPNSAGGTAVRSDGHISSPAFLGILSTLVSTASLAVAVYWFYRLFGRFRVLNSAIRTAEVPPSEDKPSEPLCADPV